MNTQQLWFAEEHLGRISLVAFTLAVCFGPTWLQWLTGALLALDVCSIAGAYMKHKNKAALDRNI